VGRAAGGTSQGSYATAVGYLAGATAQGTQAVAVGRDSGRFNQGTLAVAMGVAAGGTSQGNYAIAVGHLAGSNNQSITAVAVGREAGKSVQGSAAVAVGNTAGQSNQGNNATAVGDNAARYNQGSNAIAAGYLAGETSQGVNAVAVGAAAGRHNQGTLTVAVGEDAGNTSQGAQAVAVGSDAGRHNQGAEATAMGYLAGVTSQGAYASAVGRSSGRYNQGTNAIAVGNQAGQTSQGNSAVAAGYQAGITSQGNGAVAVGPLAGSNNQGNNALAVGYLAGQTSQGTNAVAVGYLAGQTSQHDNTVVLNASGSALDTEGTGRTYIKPLRVATVASNVMTYDQTTGEVMDSGGLFTNRLAVVSEQPPSALTGDTTTIQGHGKYVVTASSEGNAGFTAFNSFNKTIGDVNGWSSDQSYATTSPYTHTGGKSLGGVTGEWVQLELPYKTKLRHISLQSRGDLFTVSMPSAFSIISSNDNTTWTTLGSFSGLTGDDYTGGVQKQFVINATEQYKYYAIVVTNILGNPTNSRLILGELRLFTESFSVDGGIVTTTAASGLETGFTEHPVAPMTGFNTYVEGHGTYEASASSYNIIQEKPEPWRAFDYNTVTGSWRTSGFSNSTYLYTGPDVFVDAGGTRYNGPSLTIKIPYAIVLSHSTFNVWGGTYGFNTSPKVGYIFGSNNGVDWYKLFYISDFGFEDVEGGNIKTVSINATTPYTHYAFVCTEKNNSGTDTAMNFNEWRLFSATGVTKMDNVLISGELAVDGGALQTSHIKWPKVPLKANESEGYVASASSVYNSSYNAWNAFEDKGEYTSGNIPAWVSDEDLFSSGSAQISRTTGDDTFAHEWLQIQLPRAIQLSYFNILRRDTSGNRGAETPKSGYMYGSNDGVTWTKLVAYSDLTYADYQPTRVNVQSTTPYTYYRLAVTSTFGTPSYDGVGINELQLFESTLGVGTSATTAKLTVDGGLGLAKGSQVFAGSDVITEFPKHDRPLTKYPEVAMTANSSGGYVATASSQHSSYPAINLFNDSLTDRWLLSTSGGDEWSGTTYIGSNYITDINGTQHSGGWIRLKMPKQIKLSYVVQRDNSSSPPAGRVPAEVKILGTNDSTNFHLLKTFTGLSNVSLTETLFVNETQTYNEYAYVMKDTVAPEGGIDLSSLEFWGTEEGDESVDIVHRSIPNTPGQQQLAVYYEARDPNSYSFADSTKVYDLSGSGVTGTITGNNGFDAEYNAWEFDGSGDYISGTLNNATGFGNFSMSFWLNSAVLDGVPVSLGTSDVTGKRVTTTIRSDGSIRIAISSNYVSSAPVISVNQWYHIAINLRTATISTSSYELYLNGLKLNFTTNLLNGGAISLNANERLVLGADSVSFSSGFNGSIANFRLYSKVLNADQVRELYEYDAERFGYRQNLVALHKGNLGVGVPNPTSRFEVAGADGLQEYPPKAMTGYETYMEGHGVFRASSGTKSSTNGEAYLAFNKTLFERGWHGGNETDAYYTNSIYQGSLTNGGYSGDWIRLDLPYKVKLSGSTLYNRDGGYHERMPKKGVILGSNDNDKSWELVHSWDNETYLAYTEKHFIINSDSYFKSFILVVEELARTSADQVVNLGEWRLFGTPAPSSLEDGHLTLGKALTLPRVSGHPAGAETPRAESLVVHYDTTVDSVVSGSTVVDISGEGNNGTLVNEAVYSSTDRAFTFDGVDDCVSGTLNNPAGAWVHSISFWMKPSQDQSTMGTTYEDVFQIGNTSTPGKYSAFEYYNNFAQWYWYGTAVSFSGNIFSANKWVYITLVTNGTTASIYLDGALKTSGSPFTSISLNLDANASLYIGKDGTRNRAPWGGSISNFKIWGGVALTAEEVAMEYALGRTGKSINLTDTSLCLGGTVPRAQLDVRGVIYAESLLGLNDSTVAYKYFDTETTVYTFSGLNLQVGEAYKIIWHYHNVQSNHAVHMFVNGDETNGNYWHSIEQVTSSYTSSGSKIANSAKMFETGGNSDHIWVYDLRLTWDSRPMMMGHGHFSTPSATLNSSSNQAWRLGTWNHNVQTNAITSLKFDPTSTGSFGAGSSIRILKTM